MALFRKSPEKNWIGIFDKPGDFDEIIFTCSAIMPEIDESAYRAALNVHGNRLDEPGYGLDRDTFERRHFLPTIDPLLRSKVGDKLAERILKSLRDAGRSSSKDMSESAENTHFVFLVAFDYDLWELFSESLREGFILGEFLPGRQMEYSELPPDIAPRVQSGEIAINMRCFNEIQKLVKDFEPS